MKNASRKVALKICLNMKRWKNYLDRKSKRGRGVRSSWTWKYFEIPYYLKMRHLNKYTSYYKDGIGWGGSSGNRTKTSAWDKIMIEYTDSY